MRLLILIIILTNTMLRSEPNENSLKLVQDIVNLKLTSNKDSNSIVLKNYASKNNLHEDEIACSLFNIAKDIKENSDEWYKRMPRHYGLYGTIIEFLISIKYPPVRELLLTRSRIADCISQYMLVKNIFYMSKNNWFNICDSIIRDTNRYCCDTRHLLIIETIPRIFIKDQEFMQSKKDSLLNLLCIGLRLESDPEVIIFIDSLCKTISPIEYKLSRERANVIGYLESQRVKNTIPRYHPLRQKRVWEQIRKLKEEIEGRDGLIHSRFFADCFNQELDYIKK